MGWGGKAFGAGFGAMVGGPLGAAFGAGLGHLWDQAMAGDDEGDDTEDGEASEITFRGLRQNEIVTSSGPALAFEVTFESETPLSGTIVGALFFHEGEAQVPSDLASHRDEDGGLVAGGEVELSNGGRFGSFVAVVPVRAFRDWPRHPTILVVVVADGEVEGADRAELSNWPTREALVHRNFLSAIATACIGVVRSDGSLEASEVSTLRRSLVEAFELDPVGDAALRDILKAENRSPSDPSSAAARMRPHLDEGSAEPVVALLYQMAEADGHTSEVEEAWIRAFCDAAGIPRVAREAARREQEAELSSHYAALELSPGAPLEEVKRAYRRMASEYHPDRVATLPKGFQEFATNKMKAINAAYDALRKHLAPPAR
jgi:DnaJ like chaperone protein